MRFVCLAKHISQRLIVAVSDEDAFIMSLAENIARKGHRPLEVLADIELLTRARCVN